MRGRGHSNKLGRLAVSKVLEGVVAGVGKGVTQGEGVLARDERSLEANFRWARTARAAASAGVSSSSGSDTQSLPVGDEGVEASKSLKRKLDDEDDDEDNDDDGRVILEGDKDADRSSRIRSQRWRVTVKDVVDDETGWVLADEVEVFFGCRGW